MDNNAEKDSHPVSGKVSNVLALMRKIGKALELGCTVMRPSP